MAQMRKGEGMPAKNDPDRVHVKERKGTWRRFVRLFFRCRLPWLFLALYIALEFLFVNIGVDQTDATAQLFAGDTSAASVARLIGLIVANLLLGNLVVFVGAVTSARIDRNMRGVLTEKLMRLPLSYFKEDSPREAIYRILQNCIVITSTIMLFLIPVATALYKSASIVRRVFTHDWRLSAVMLAFVPVQIFLAFLFGRINFFLSSRDADLHAGLMHRLAETITNIPLAKAFAREDREEKKGEELVDRLYRVSIRGGWFDQFRDLGGVAVSLTQAVVMTLTGMSLLGNGEITTRGWITFFLFSSTFNGAISEFMIYWNNIKIIQGGADKVAEIMDAMEEDYGGEQVEHLNGDLTLSDVTFGYDPEKPVIKGLSCTFPAGTRTALLGVSGCGKTTLTSLLMRLYDPQSGEVQVGGKNARDYALDDYRRQFVMVSQNDMIFSGTIRENVCYGHGDVPEEKILEALKLAGAYDFVMERPEGLDARVEEYGSNLSGGQRQKLAMARAALSSAPYMILDEPAASMDALAVSALMESIRRISEGRSLILIGHSPSVLTLAERVVVLENGKASFEGPLSEGLKKSDFVRALSKGEVSAE